MSKQLMWDIESYGTRPSAVVLSIGATIFDPQGDGIGATFYGVLEIDDQLRVGRTTDQSTIDWWAAQSEAARQVFSELTAPPTDVLANLAEFITAHDVEGVWGNGSDFDNVIIADLFRSYGIDPPWAFWKNRCLRTMKALSLPKTYVKPERISTHHNALDDAVHQVFVLQAIVRALGLRI